MKSLLRKIVPVLLLMSLLSATAWGQGRIATVDLRKVFDNYWKTKQADAALKDRGADIQKEHQNMLDDWKKGKEEYQTLLTEANLPAHDHTFNAPVPEPSSWTMLILGLGLAGAGLRRRARVVVA